MKNSLSIRIASPCGENWGNFTTTASGGFCSSCSKEVIDFTNMSDEKILEFFQGAPSGICGKFRKPQLKSYLYETSEIRPGTLLLKVGLLALALTLVDNSVFAIPTQGRATPEISLHEGELTLPALSDVGEELTVKGVILAGADNSPLPGANILLKGSEIGTVADQDGRFEFPKKLKAGDVLQISFIGFRMLEYTVSPGTVNTIELKLELAEEIMLGEIVVGGVYAQPQSRLHQLWNKITKIF